MNTQRNTAWAMRVFQEWKAERSKGDAEKCPENLLGNPDPQNLNCWLSRFVVEIRKQDGRPYPPRTIRQVCKGTCWKSCPMLQSSWIALTQRFVNFMEHVTVCIVVSISKASGQKCVLFSFMSVSVSVLEGVMNNGNWGLRTHDPDCFTYIEHGSKNRSGGSAQLQQVCSVLCCA